MSVNDTLLVEQLFDQYKKSFADDNSEDSAIFEIFAVDNILKDYDLSYQEIRDGITDGSADGGIDAVYMFINGELVSEDTNISQHKKDINIEIVVFQSKKTNSFKENAVDKMSSCFHDFFGDLKKDTSGLHSVYNEKIIESFDLIRSTYKKLATKFPTLDFRIYYSTLSPDQPHENVSRKADRLVGDIKTKYFSQSESSFVFIDAEGLLEHIRRNQKATLSLKYVGNPLTSPFGESYVCLVNIKDFFNFISDDNSRLRKSIFEANVRDYQGNAQLNQQIRDTLTENNQDDFWWLNNGITILSTSTNALISNNELIIENPQIVNGLQTSTEIFAYAKKASILSERRNVLVRIIKSDNEDSRNRIIQATNSQTDMPYASLRATDKIHSDIEDHFKSYGLYYDRRKNYHKNEGKPARAIISIASLAQAVMAVVLQRPNDARGRPTTLLKDDTNYNIIFSDTYHLNTYLNCILLKNKIDSYLQTFPDKRARTNCRFHALMLLSMKACGLVNVKAESIARVDINAITANDVAASALFSFMHYKELGGSDNVAKGKEFIAKLKEIATGFVGTDSGEVMSQVSRWLEELKSKEQDSEKVAQ